MEISGGVPVALAAKYRARRDDDDQHADHAELAVQIGVGPFADGPGDLLHPRCSLRSASDLPDEHQSVSQPGQGDDHIGDQGNFFVGLKLVADERFPENDLRLRRTRHALRTQFCRFWRGQFVADLCPGHGGQTTECQECQYERRNALHLSRISELRGLWFVTFF